MKTAPRDEDGYELWLRYPRLDNAVLRAEYGNALGHVALIDDSATLKAAAHELRVGLGGLLGAEPEIQGQLGPKTALVALSERQLAALFASEPLLARAAERALIGLGREGFVICRLPNRTELFLLAPSDIGVLYGAFHLLGCVQSEKSVARFVTRQVPKLKLRMLNHWDNLDRSVERGYAGFSLWEWQVLPDYCNPRYTDYARAVASVGLNAVVLTNVNANARLLTDEFLTKVQALADVLRPYGIAVYLTARFSAPVELGDLGSADPALPEVQHWWRNKVGEIYAKIADFGGFLVKANSEGQPGPQDYGRSHADGANLLADALAPHGGVCLWRAFVYDHHVPEDRAKQAYDEFVPRDGQFRHNAFIQVKNGPIDFQPREPFHPLFGAMPKTPLLLEVQLTQEYLGLATHLVYLAPLFKEVLDADTYAQGPGSTVARVIDGTLENHRTSGIAAVTNIGNDRNWCGHPFAQANWYAFGRLAWDHSLSAETIAEEWVRRTFSNDTRFVKTAVQMMLASREACVDYMTPLGLHHIMAWSHHYGPGPWIDSGRADWTSVYYHRADHHGIGFERTASGSNAVAQYAPGARDHFESPSKCPENLLLWFHHVAWDSSMSSGRTLWDELCHRYYRGWSSVQQMQVRWDELAGVIDARRHAHVKSLLAVQAKEARWWAEACLLYFQTFSERPIPAEYPPPLHDLEYYRTLKHHYVPGN